jgi:Copper amine oxidase, enzyme domain
MPGAVEFAGWSLCWQIRKLAGEGLVILGAEYKKKRVLLHASQPFVLVPYHFKPNTTTPVATFKDGIAPKCIGLPLTALKPSAPNTREKELPPDNYATNDDRYDLITNPFGAVVVEEHEASYIEPEHIEIWAKFQCGNYQYVQLWEFLADGSIHARVGLGGKLSALGPEISHIHNFYFRLNFDIDSAGNNQVQRFEHQGLGDMKQDVWVPITTEGKDKFDWNKFTKWRVINKTPKANGKVRSYEILPGSEGGPDVKYSTGDLWVLRNKGDQDIGGVIEGGAEVDCVDEALLNKYAATAESVDGQDIVVWYCLRGHHLPREQGEEKKVLPYHFLEFHMEPRDFLDDTPLNLYPTVPSSP